MEFRINPSIAVSESGMVFNPTTGESFTLNPQGFEIYSLIRQGKTIKQILARIMEKYTVEKTEADRDLEDFVGELARYGMISPV